MDRQGLRGAAGQLFEFLLHLLCADGLWALQNVIAVSAFFNLKVQVRIFVYNRIIDMRAEAQTWRKQMRDGKLSAMLYVPCKRDYIFKRHLGQKVLGNPVYDFLAAEAPCCGAAPGLRVQDQLNASLHLPPCQYTLKSQSGQ